MTVSTIASLATGIGRNLSKQDNRIADSVRNLLSAQNTNTSRDDIATLSGLTLLRAPLPGLREAAQSIAQASSLLETADDGAAQINRTLDKLRDLANRASATNLTAQQRGTLNAQFQSLRQEIDRIANATSFGGSKLLDGTLKNGGENVGGTTLDLSIGGLRDEDLFEAPVDLLSASNASDAARVIGRAKNIVANERSELNALAQGFYYAAATLDAALQNQEAAGSSLNDNDFTFATAGNARANLQAQLNAALQVQTKRLPGGILQLLNE